MDPSQKYAPYLCTPVQSMCQRRDAQCERNLHD
jgi:hypothetical protein